MFERITINIEQMNGEPCIRNLRIPVSTILSMLAQGLSAEKIINYYLDLTIEDIQESLNFAAEALREKELPLLKTA